MPLRGRPFGNRSSFYDIDEWHTNKKFHLSLERGPYLGGTDIWINAMVNMVLIVK